MIVPGSALGLAGATPPSDRITVAGHGIGNRGENDLESFLAQKDVQFLAICDVRNERREAIKSKADKHYGNNDCAMYGEMYDLWARKDIDAVLIATGDRWHTLLSILTAKSGKDVYCEKPCSMTIDESRDGGLVDLDPPVVGEGRSGEGQEEQCSEKDQVGAHDVSLRPNLSTTQIHCTTDTESDAAFHRRQTD